MRVSEPHAAGEKTALQIHGLLLHFTFEVLGNVNGEYTETIQECTRTLSHASDNADASLECANMQRSVVASH